MAACLAAAVWGWTARSAVPDVFDSREYAWTAWHLAHAGVFSAEQRAGPAEQRAGPAEPGVGREPGYPAALAVLLRIVPGLDGIAPDCLSRPEGCGLAAWRPAVAINGAFIGLAGLAVFALVRLLDAGPLAAWLAGAHIWLNAQAASSRGYLLSDYLAMLLVALASLSLVWAWKRDGWWRWAVAGFAFAALTLTKAIFLWLVGPALAVALLVVPFDKRHRRRRLLALVLFAAAYAAPVGGWMARNATLDGSFAITVGRTSIALSTREVFNHMTPAQYAAAFVYWTRGFGDDLAKRLFPEEVWGPFEIYREGGFYMTGQHRLSPEIAALMTQHGLTLGQADRILARQVMGDILDWPFVHAITTLPLFWRGIWVDEFIVVSLPALAWLLLHLAACRRSDILLAVSPGLFSLVFYALVSLNIPRYQLTAMPALAVAFGLGVAALAASLRRRRSRQTACSNAGE